MKRLELLRSWILVLVSAWIAAPCPQTLVWAQDIRAPFDLETARVLPGGIRSPRFKTVFTSIDERFDGQGTAQPVSAKLNKTVTFADVIAARSTDAEKNEIRGLLSNAGLSETDSPGFTTGDVAVAATVFAPVFSIGLTDWWTAAIAAPIYFVNIHATSAFVAGPSAQRVIDEANKSGIEKANEVADKLNNAVNEKLARLGYQPIANKSFTALSDIRIINKFKVLESGDAGMMHTVTLKGEATLPTGRVQSPDDLLSIPVGDGQWDLGAGVIYDLTLASIIRLNAFGGYTAQLPSTMEHRLPTSATDSLSADKERVWKDLGDLASTGSSVSLDLPGTGVTLGAGYMYQFMNTTSVRNGTIAAASRYRLLEDLFPLRDLHSGLLMVGFSSVEMFKAKRFPLPFQANLTYSAPFGGRNSTTNSMLQTELVLFF